MSETRKRPLKSEDDYHGSSGRRGFTRRHPVWTAVALLAVVVLVVPLAIVAIAYVSVDVPEEGSLETNQVSEIYWSDDSTLMGRIVPDEGNRTNVALQDVPVHVRDAVIAAEDRTFYSNEGFDPVGIARAALGQLTGEDTGGGSTITQQYVKNTMVGDAVTYERKAREILIAAKMTTEWSKDEILESYLNTIYFGRGAYGVAAAAEAYFDKPVEALTLEEGALLASIIQSPSAHDPIANRPGVEARWNYVLDGMEDMGTVPPGQRQVADFPFVMEDAQQVDVTVGDPSNGPIRRQVLAELAFSGIDENMLNTRGLRITTTIDPTVQESVLSSVNNNMASTRSENRTAVVSIDPNTGAVRGYYGGDDAEGWDYANAPLQTGSVFKIFGLAAALDQGIPLTQPYSSSPVMTGDVQVTNVGGQSCGTCSISEALRLSLNTSFIRLQSSLSDGAVDTAEIAHRAGIAKDIPGLPWETLTEQGERPFDGIVLGQYPVRPLDMASSIATFADEGMYHQNHFIERVVASDGEVLIDNSDPEGEQVIDEDVANNLTSAMEPIAAYSQGKSLAGGRPSAAKTGTTQLGDTGYNQDAWFVGYTPSLATAVWVGTDDNQPLLEGTGATMYGSGLPGSIWKSTMDGALVNTEWESFPTPGPIGGQAGRPSGTGSSGSTSSGGGQATTQAPSAGGQTQETETQEAPPQEGSQDLVIEVPGMPDIVIPGAGGGGTGGGGGGGQGAGGGTGGGGTGGGGGGTGGGAGGNGGGPDPNTGGGGDAGGGGAPGGEAAGG